MAASKQTSIPATDVLRMVRHLLHFPFAQICVHSVAGDLLDALERNGLAPDADFEAAVAAVVRAHDAKAIAAIDRLLVTHAVDNRPTRT